MAIDYKARPPTPKPRRRSGKACGFWFVFGLVLGGFGVGLYLMVQAPIQAPAPSAVAARPEPAKPGASAPTRLDFDFHDILPELEVVVSDSELAKPDEKRPEDRKPEDTKPEEKKAEEKRPEEKKTEVAKKPETPKTETAKAEGAGAYMVQIASLRTAADADRLKAQLAMQGIQVKVQSVTVNGKDTYHRVQAGPYQGKQAVSSVRDQLKAKGMDSLVVKLK